MRVCLFSNNTLRVCLPLQDMNLRELTVKYGRNVGLNITSQQLHNACVLLFAGHEPARADKLSNTSPKR
jgi:hypothetical protein